MHGWSAVAPEESSDYIQTPGCEASNEAINAVARKTSPMTCCFSATSRKTSPSGSAKRHWRPMRSPVIKHLRVARQVH